MINMISMSGGKDSTATMLVAIDRGAENIEALFCDTGNEHAVTYDHVGYLEQALGIPIKRIRQDFSKWWWHRRGFIAGHWVDRGVDEQVVEATLAFFDTGPTGNPFLDLCIIKGRFPSRKAQFCTQFLKTEPATGYQLERMEATKDSLTSWQGVRADESPGRAKLPERESVGGGMHNYRPILSWNVEQVFEIHRRFGIKPNPLYLQGMSRVGCMPCINAKKDEVLEISKRFPEHIDRIAEWELLVGKASKRRNATMFAAPGDNETAYERGNIRQAVQWSGTKRGGRLMDMFRVMDEPKQCSSAYGLCE